MYTERNEDIKFEYADLETIKYRNQKLHQPLQQFSRKLAIKLYEITY